MTYLVGEAIEKILAGEDFNKLIRLCVNPNFPDQVLAEMIKSVSNDVLDLIIILCDQP